MSEQIWYLTEQKTSVIGVEYVYYLHSTSSEEPYRPCIGTKHPGSQESIVVVFQNDEAELINKIYQLFKDQLVSPTIFTALLAKCYQQGRTDGWQSERFAGRGF